MEIYNPDSKWPCVRRDSLCDFVLVEVTHIVRDTDGPWLERDHCMLSFRMIPGDVWREPTHTLKTLTPWFKAVASGDKTAELRKDDRGFKVGDVLRLNRYS